MRVTALRCRPLWLVGMLIAELRISTGARYTAEFSPLLPLGVAEDTLLYWAFDEGSADPRRAQVHATGAGEQVAASRQDGPVLMGNQVSCRFSRSALVPSGVAARCARRHSSGILAISA